MHSQVRWSQVLSQKENSEGLIQTGKASFARSSGMERGARQAGPWRELDAPKMTAQEDSALPDRCDEHRLLY